MSGDAVTCVGCGVRVEGWALVPAIERAPRPRALCEGCAWNVASLVARAAAEHEPDGDTAARDELFAFAYRLRGRQ